MVLLFFSRIFISHFEDFDLFGGFTDLVLFFQVSFCMLPTWNFRKISEILKLKKKFKNAVTPFCLERNSEQSFVFFKNSKNFRISFYEFCLPYINYMQKNIIY